MSDNRSHYPVTYKGRKMFVEASVRDKDPSVGIFGYWSEEHALLDPETEEHRPDWEAEMTDEDWDKVADLFDDIANKEILIENFNFELEQARCD